MTLLIGFRKFTIAHSSNVTCNASNYNSNTQLKPGQRRATARVDL